MSQTTGILGRTAGAQHTSLLGFTAELHPRKSAPTPPNKTSGRTRPEPRQRVPTTTFALRHLHYSQPQPTYYPFKTYFSAQGRTRLWQRSRGSLTSATKEQEVTSATSWGIYSSRRLRLHYPESSAWNGDYTSQDAPRPRSALAARSSRWLPRLPFLGNVPRSLVHDHCGTSISFLFFLKPRSQNM